MNRIAKKALVEQLHGERVSSYRRYCNKALGDVNFISFLKYELITFMFGNMGGAAGFFLRKIFYKTLFRASGESVILGEGVTIRHPSKISLGKRVAIDEHCLLDAGGSGEAGVIIGDDVVVSRNCVIQGKTGYVKIGSGTDIGCNTVITSVSGVDMGRNALIAANCYIGGARYVIESREMAVSLQGTYSRGPVIFEDGIWLGAGVMVLDGVRLGKGVIVGAGSVVTKSIPEFSIAMGVPAKVVSVRKRNK